MSTVVKRLVEKHERIQNLYSIGPVQQAEVEGFVEEIAQECARVLWSIDSGDLHTEYVNALKQHFGVK